MRLPFLRFAISLTGLEELQNIKVRLLKVDILGVEILTDNFIVLSDRLVDSIDLLKHTLH